MRMSVTSPCMRPLPHPCCSAARCLVANPHLQLANYLHQLMPAVMTCLVARRLGTSPAGAQHAAHI